MSALSEYWLAARREQKLTQAELCRRLRANSVCELWERCASRPYPFVHRVDRAEFEKLCPGEFEQIRAGAEAALAHRVDLLGSGPIELGPRIDWLTDFKSGIRWPTQYWRTVAYGEPADVKVPWELSRLQWLIPLAQMYLLTGEERYAAGAGDIVEQWIASNPYAWSVNWACTMEAAIRILTLTFLFHALHGSEAFANPDFRYRFLKSLYLHGDFTERHLERSDINGNHFTSDAAGLVFAGLFFGNGADPGRWQRLGLRSLEREVQLQVLDDGVVREGSIGYHRLVCELFVLPAIYAETSSRRVSTVWKARLRGMAAFVAGYSREDGSSPLWGDADDARALPMRHGSPNDHRYLIAMVSAFLKDEGLSRKFSGPVAEVFWLRGAQSAARLLGTQPDLQPSQAFPTGGLYVMRRGEDHVFVQCGNLAFAGRGGHAHNDLLSLEASLNGQKLVSDSGCYLYTSAIGERNRFRSTASHNTPMIDDEEINRFVPGELWVLRNDARAEVRDWKMEDETSLLVASHSGYKRLKDPVTVVRRLHLNHRDHRLKVEDRFEGAGAHRIAVPLYFDPLVTVEEFEERRAVLVANGKRFELTWDAPGWKAAVTPARVAPSYGVVVPSMRVLWTYDGAMPASLTYRIAAMAST
ncbi:MAG: alginate lyase family protein [Proteobacteria bacterium]|nr:alginate lyase family protein [Pseudomonadota bacterium]